MKLKTPFDGEPLFYELFIKTYQELVAQKVTPHGQKEIEKMLLDLSKEFGFDCLREVASAFEYARELYLKPPSKEVHNELMSYELSSPEDRSQKSEEVLIKKMSEELESLCFKYPNIASDILDVEEQRLLECLDSSSSAFVVFSKYSCMLKLIALRQVRQEILCFE